MNKQGDLTYTFHDTMGEGGKYELETEVHTSTHLPVPLFSVDKLYATGDWDFLLRDSKRGGPAFVMYGKDDTIVHNIPLE